MKLLHFALPIVFAGCGAEPAAPRVAPHAIARDGGSDAARDGANDASESNAVDPAHLAPGMREVVRSEIAIASNAQVAIPPNAEADVCVRVAVRPTSVRAKLVSKGGVLGEGATIGDKGPVCVRKGDALTVDLAVETPTRATVIVWSSP